jgi:nucleotide-binding universal stress UspA family protein
MKTAELEPVETDTDLHRMTPAVETSSGDVIEMVPLILSLKNILVPIDFSDTSLNALQYAVAFAKQFEAKITLLHVILPVPPAAEVPLMAGGEHDVFQAAERQIEEIAHSRISSSVLLQTLTRSGFAFDTIVSVARETSADIIILTTHGYTGLKHMLIGSTAECVVRHAPCPVLVVREREHEFA